MIALIEIVGGQQQHDVAVDDAAVIGHKQSAIGVAVEGDAEIGFAGDDFFLKPFEMQRAATVLMLRPSGSLPMISAETLRLLRSLGLS